MNRYPLWKNLLVVTVILTAIIYAMPNLFGDDPAVQVSAGRLNNVDLQLVNEIESSLKQAEIPYKGVVLEENRLLIRFSEANEQLEARELIQQKLSSEDYIVALNLAPNTPAWLQSLGAEPMNLGLDLRGGVHFLMEVDMDAVLKQTLESYASDIRILLRDKTIRYTQVNVENGVLTFGFREAADLDAAIDAIDREYNELVVAIDENAERPTVTINLNDTIVRETQNLALQQNITTLRNRINELGVAEPTVQQQGQDRIVVQLPGVQDTAQAKKILGATATLEFRLVDFESDVQDAVNGRVPANSELYYHRDGRPYLLNKRVMLTGEHVINAASTIDGQSGSPAVSVTLDGKGARIFSNITRDNIGNPMAVVFIESKVETQIIDGEEVSVRRQIPEIISVATIRDQLGKKFQITGLDSTTEARDLALLLRAGALAAPIDIVEERTVGPSLGQENIDQGFASVMIGFALVLVFMIVWYRLFGAVANLALAANLVLIVALLSMLQATLTMPGIAGIVLTVGMAVDANVLIFERIREELRLGNSPRASIDAGYSKAFSTIADANITTLIAAIVLFGFGTGTIKGFAITLTLGILTSMFTAIVGTRMVINLVYGRKQRPKLSI
ncbi:MULTISPECIES: protein translocase subunit SecD [unclassified Methylophaga]|jgi:preprotein translocase subunit SecD|uniref:protein translocase subunit SecD n=1 Tax=unclassified Methylophaga TaxID=2629249 RepID=UPI000C3ECDDB|nr:MULTISPECIES: protein translocase subunit SecD [unclassified Methylophaga]MAL50643.1 protein translocase subunit SecD [Methylophaga sp.]MBP24062.1 protein translocase subunit SecD [Methylophaga sp.]MDX1749597.1 protein translocase subunit SecD [Methylophaga sp.]|tara:strand:+ start:3740 stop:5596 length:1857 start_codon:yes stop_codon:yes gene_type:complete